MLDGDEPSLAAAALALESLALALWFARYSLALRATTPLDYVVAGGLMSAFVVYGRYALRPFHCPPRAVNSRRSRCPGWSAAATRWGAV